MDAPINKPIPTAYPNSYITELASNITTIGKTYRWLIQICQHSKRAVGVFQKPEQGTTLKVVFYQTSFTRFKNLLY
ncbi:hypothetical protein ACTJIP_08610 [Chryseobacterium sp. 22543]